MPGEGSKKERGNNVIKFLPTELGDALLRTNLRSWGTAMSVILCLLTLSIWVIQGSSTLNNAFSVIAKTSAFTAITLLSLNFILATRLTIFEELFGGIDRLYKVHKLVGKMSLLFILVHVITLVIKNLPSANKVAKLLVPGLEVPITYGILSLLFLVLLLFLTFVARLPYERWHMTHRLMIVPLVLASWHALQAGSDIRRYEALEAWVIIITLAGVISYLYTVGLYRYIGPTHMMNVTSIRRMGNITEIELEDPCKDFNFHPGQFVFIRFRELQDDYEMHPFSISSSPKDKYVRISAKRTGDFTKDILPKVSIGDEAKVMGPYGRFGERYLGHKKDMVWVAGGIGITPFLSMARWEAKNPSGRKTVVIWSYKSEDDAAYLAELMECSSANPDMVVVPWRTTEKGRLDASKVSELVGGEGKLKEMAIFMCGPVQMMDSLSRQFLASGVSARNLVFEDFDLM